MPRGTFEKTVDDLSSFLYFSVHCEARNEHFDIPYFVAAYVTIMMEVVQFSEGGGEWPFSKLQASSVVGREWLAKIQGASA